MVSVIVSSRAGQSPRADYSLGGGGPPGNCFSSRTLAQLSPRHLSMTRPQTGVLLLYSATIFLGAGLLFVVQPMVGKMVLPLLGGTPAVWST